MDELTIIRQKLADLESKLEDANERKMPSVTNKWIVAECRKSVNKIERDEQLYIDAHKAVLDIVEKRIIECKLIVPPNESIMTPLSHAIMANPKGPWRVKYQLWHDDGNMSMGLTIPSVKADTYDAQRRPGHNFVEKMVKKHHSEMMKETFPTATWECHGSHGPITIWVTFPDPVDSTDTLLS